MILFAGLKTPSHLSMSRILSLKSSCRTHQTYSCTSKPGDWWQQSRWRNGRKDCRLDCSRKTSDQLSLFKRSKMQTRPIVSLVPALSATAVPSTTEQVSFTISPEQISAGCAETSLTQTQYLTSLLKGYTELARPPISLFRVAAIGLGESGRAYAGVNLEIPGVPLYNSVHAEQFVVANAMQHGETKIRQILVNHAPCGHCRQFLQELRNAEEINIVIADYNAESSSLQHFLPHRFGPQDLLHEDSPLLLEKRDNKLMLASDRPKVYGSIGHADNGASASSSSSKRAAASPSNGAPRAEASNGASKGEAKNMALAEAALAAANLSYAPYSLSPSGVAVRLKTGEIFSGSYLESAAYNPSLPPLQAAMVALVAQSQARFSEVAEVALVELPGAQVQFAESIGASVEKLSPGAIFSVWDASV